MYILAIETTGPVGSVSLIKVPEGEDACPGQCGRAEEDACREQGGVPGKDAYHGLPIRITTRAMSHLKRLMPMIDDLMKSEAAGKDEIAAVAVSVGPGSFTGIRIGVTTGRALAQAWDVPCISVGTLDTFREKCGAGSAGGAPVLAILNARRGQVYGALFGADGEALMEPGPYMLKDMFEKTCELGISPVIYGDGIDAYQDKEGFRDWFEKFSLADEEDRYQDARMVARLALGEYLDGKACGYGELLPDYMRESEAEQRLKDGSLEKMRKAKLERMMHS